MTTTPPAPGFADTSALRQHTPETAAKVTPRRSLRGARVAAALGVLGLCWAGLAATPSVAKPVGSAVPEVRELSIPGLPSAERTVLKAAGKRAGGRQLAALPARQTPKFSTVGVTWAPGTKQAPQVEVRVRTGGVWGSWQLLETEDGGPNGAEAAKARPGTTPLWVGDSDGVEVRVLSNSTATAAPEVAGPSDLEVALIDPKSLPADPVVASKATTMAAAAAPALPYLYPQPKVVSRSAWGADESLRSYNGSDCAKPSYDDTIKAAIVHHTAGSNSYTAAQSAAQVRGIYAYHVKTQGWCDIGYNFLIDKYGTVFEGRYGGVTKPVQGAHATSWNTDTVGVSLMGNFETATPTPAILESTAKLLAWKLEANYHSGTGTLTLAGKKINIIAGHGDVMATLCPGKNMRSKMAELRANVTTKIGSYNTPIYQRWQALGGAAGWVKAPYVGEQVILNGRVTQFGGADILWSRSTGARWVKGSIRTKYRALGMANHYLGFPTSDEVAGPYGSTMNKFVSGAIYSSAGTGAVDVYRVFYTRYTTMGATQVYLGLPVASQVPGRISGSQFQKFQTGGLYWSSATGGHDMYRVFYDYYEGLGANVTRLGLPTAPQQPGAVAGSQFQTFQKGALYWTRAGGTKEVNGQIYLAYKSLGAEKSRLGLPTRSDYAVTGGRATDFQGGKIVWTAATNKTVVTYK